MPKPHRRLFLAVIEGGASEADAALDALPVDLHPVAVSRIAACLAPEEQAGIAARLQEFDWLLLTSANAATLFFNAFPWPQTRAPKIACVGPNTAECVRRFGHPVVFIAEEHRGDAFAEAFLQREDAAQASVLLPRPEKMAGKLPEILAEGGVNVTQAILYRTEAQPQEALPDLQFSDADLFAFLSPSGVKNFARRYAIPPNAAVFAIGPTTAEAIAALGCKNIHIAAEYCRSGLVDAVRDFLDNENKPEVIQS